MSDPKTDESRPGGRDPAEGGRGENRGAPPVQAPEDSHLGPAGDPVEGAEETA